MMSFFSKQSAKAIEMLGTFMNGNCRSFQLSFISLTGSRVTLEMRQFLLQSLPTTSGYVYFVLSEHVIHKLKLMVLNIPVSPGSSKNGGLPFSP